jgi:hypothetical protein
MEMMKIKRILMVILITVLSAPTIILLYLNAVALAVLFNPPEADYSQEQETLRQYELLKWEYDTKLKYASEAYCEIQEALPPEGSTLGVKVYYHEEKIPIETTLNPYPEYTQIYEVGIVNRNDNPGIETLFNTQSGRLYRIELKDNPDIYLEYISDRNDPHLHIVEDFWSSEFLIYPILLNSKDLVVDNEFYLEIM